MTINLIFSIYTIIPLFYYHMVSGMRRKNLYIMEVDVYQAAVNLSPEAQVILKKSLSDPNASISDAIIAINSGCKAAVTLRFVRDVEKNKIVEAFNDNFSELNQNDVKAFKEALGSSIGATGLKKNDELVFFWTSDGIIITKNNVVGNKFRSASGDAVERRLLEVYLDPVRYHPYLYFYHYPQYYDYNHLPEACCIT